MIALMVLLAHHSQWLYHSVCGLLEWATRWFLSSTVRYADPGCSAVMLLVFSCHYGCI